MVDLFSMGLYAGLGFFLGQVLIEIGKVLVSEYVKKK